MDISFRRSQNRYIPIFLDDSQSEGIKEYINEFERVVGLTEGDLDQNRLINVFSDRKLARGLLKSIIKSFYSLKGLDFDQQFAPWESRILLYKLMEKKGLNWASYREQKEIVKELRNTNSNLSLITKSQDELTNYLFADHSINYKIIRKIKKAPTVREVITRFNTDLIQFLFKKSLSFKFQISVSKLTGDLVKQIIRNIKMWNLHLDILKNEDETVLFQILGPLELVGRSTKYGKRLFSLYLLVKVLKIIRDIILEIQYYERRMTISIPNDSFLILQEKNDKVISQQFDSKVEEQFFKYFTANFPNWTIDREPVIIESNLVMIPDFFLIYRGIQFYFEIVGFWTERYLHKKVQKIHLLKNKYPNIVLLVDQSLNFPDTGVKTFKYGKRFPLAEIGSWLTTQEIEPFNNFIIYLKSKIVELLQSIRKILTNNDFIDAKGLKKIFQTLSKSETKKVCKLIMKPYLSEIKSFILIEEPLLMKITFIQTLKDELENKIAKSGILMSQLESEYPNLNPRIFRRLLKLIGYKYEFKSLIEEKFIPTQHSVHITPDIY